MTNVNKNIFDYLYNKSPLISIVRNVLTVVFATG